MFAECTHTVTDSLHDLNDNVFLKRIRTIFTREKKPQHILLTPQTTRLKYCHSKYKYKSPLRKLCRGIITADSSCPGIHSLTSSVVWSHEASSPLSASLLVTAAVYLQPAQPLFVSPLTSEEWDVCGTPNTGLWLDFSIEEAVWKSCAPALAVLWRRRPSHQFAVPRQGAQVDVQRALPPHVARALGVERRLCGQQAKTTC